MNQDIQIINRVLCSSHNKKLSMRVGSGISYINCFQNWFHVRKDMFSDRRFTEFISEGLYFSV